MSGLRVQLSDGQKSGNLKSDIRHPIIWRSGYTLIEILVVLALGAIVFVGGYTAYQDFARRQVLDNAHEELKSNFALARQLALAGEKPAGFCESSSSFSLLGHQINLESGQYKIQAKCSNDVTSDVRTFLLPSGISITSGWTTSNPILFKALGEGADQNVTITIMQNSTSDTKQIQVSTQGRIE